MTLWTAFFVYDRIGFKRYFKILFFLIRSIINILLKNKTNKNEYSKYGNKIFVISRKYHENLEKFPRLNETF